jgi:hypothetical protein
VIYLGRAGTLCPTTIGAMETSTGRAQERRAFAVKANAYSPDAIWDRHPHVPGTEQFEFSGPADLFSGDCSRGKRRAMSYRRFPTGVEALRFAVERQSAERLSTTIIETDEVRIEGDEIARLYASDAYPFERGGLQ